MAGYFIGTMSYTGAAATLPARLFHMKQNMNEISAQKRVFTLSNRLSPFAIIARRLCKCRISA
jgi:hypothetical protein